MIDCQGTRCLILLELDRQAEQVLVCGDGWIGRRELRRRGRGRWALAMRLTPGWHRLRYYARFGPTLVCCGTEAVRVMAEPDAAPARRTMPRPDESVAPERLSDVALKPDRAQDPETHPSPRTRPD